MGRVSRNPETKIFDSHCPGPSFGVLCHSVIGNPVPTTSGSHFCSLFTHLALITILVTEYFTYLLCLVSIMPHLFQWSPQVSESPGLEEVESRCPVTPERCGDTPFPGHRFPRAPGRSLAGRLRPMRRVQESWAYDQTQALETS